MDVTFAGSPLLSRVRRTNSLEVVLILVTVLLATPLFVRIGGPSLIGPPENTVQRVGGYTLPLGAFACAATAAVLYVVRWRRHLSRMSSALDAPVLIFIAVCVLSLLLGLILRPGIYNIMYFVQTTAPISAYYLASRVNRSERRTHRVMVGLGAAAVASGASLLFYALLERGPSRLFASDLPNHVGPLNIYQSNDYVPFVLAIVFLFSLASLVRRERLGIASMLFLFVLALVALASYARGPVLVLIAGLGVLVGQSWRLHPVAVAKAMLVAVSAFMVAVTLGFSSVARVADVAADLVSAAGGAPSGSGDLSTTTPTAGASARKTAAPTTTARVSPAPGPSTSLPSQVIRSPNATPRASVEDISAQIGGDSQSNESRLLSIQIAADFIRRNPLFGSGFAPIPWQELSPLVKTLPPNLLFPAHNQYLDLGLRGGVPLLFAFAWIALASARLAWRGLRLSNPIGSAFAAGALAMLVPTLAVGNMYQDNFTQPFPAFLLWYILGTLSACENLADTRGGA